MTNSCVDPPELETAQLLAFLDGEADPSVEEHLRTCAYCRERAGRLARLEGGLAARLYRVDCPSSLELGEYQLGRLGRERSAAISQHLRECPHCAREVAQLVTFLGDLEAVEQPGPLERALEKVRVTVARLVSGLDRETMGISPGLTPAFAGIRGDDRQPYIYDADGVQIAIDISEDDRQPGRTLFGMVIGADIGDLKAHLWRGNELVASVVLDELGNFKFEGLLPGHYELLLSDPDSEIFVQDLVV